jgi:hypothetical protein
MKIPFAPEYDVTENGVVTNKHGKRLTPYLHHSGYIMVNLWVNHTKKLVGMHKIMAETFLPKPTGAGPWTVNHKDKDKTNYALSNLEWLTNANNISHGQGKAIAQVLNGKIIAVYASSQEAARSIGRPNGGSVIRAVCRKEPGRVSYANYEWRYI